MAKFLLVALAVLAMALSSRAASVVIVSDVDDTIRDTRVHLAGTPLVNPALLFDGLHDWHQVPGMAPLYRGWQAATQARVVYLSAGPERYRKRLTQTLFTDWRFPSGTLFLYDGSHAKAPHPFKMDLLRPMLMRERDIGSPTQFVLVGDSGERDPEIYGEAARLFPAQVAAIYIHEVTNKPSTDPRYVCAFHRVPPSKVHLFRDAADLAAYRQNPLRRSTGR